MTSKRQQTMSKIAREREVKERRARKLEKKHAAAAERKAKTEGATFPISGETYAGLDRNPQPDQDRPVEGDQ